MVQKRDFTTLQEVTWAKTSGFLRRFLVGPPWFFENLVFWLWSTLGGVTFRWGGSRYSDLGYETGGHIKDKSLKKKGFNYYVLLDAFVFKGQNLETNAFPIDKLFASTETVTQSSVHTKSSYCNQELHIEKVAPPSEDRGSEM